MTRTLTGTLTGAVYLTLLSVALVLGDTEQRAAALLVAAVLLARLAVRRHGTTPPQVRAASGVSAPRGLAECPSPVAPVPEG
jgi:hypothetical protein